MKTEHILTDADIKGMADGWLSIGGSQRELARRLLDLKAALKAVDDSWTEYHPQGPDQPQRHFGEISEETVAIWKQIRAALADG